MAANKTKIAYATWRQNTCDALTANVSAFVLLETRRARCQIRTVGNPKTSEAGARTGCGDATAAQFASQLHHKSRFPSSCFPFRSQPKVAFDSGKGESIMSKSSSQRATTNLS